ncbi:L,D-transpeptidase family protein [Kitasatospora sp. NPDC058162]|uniref:L,D-transpeptidase family protein n=1 Tax=Kitasatospora sp. NPDC058162 TaxID=3346362 RepID=UPI0036DB84FF
MSGSHRATEYPPYEPMQEPVYGVPQQSHEAPYAAYEPYQQPVAQEYYGEYRQTADGYSGTYEQSFQPFQPYVVEPEPGYQAPAHQEPVFHEPSVYQETAYQEPAYQEPAYQEPVYEQPVYDQPAPVEPLASVTPLAAAAPEPGGRAAARGRRRKAKPKRHGKAVMAGTALLVAAAAGWYTVGQDGTKSVAAAADGPGPEGVSKPDHPVTPDPAAVQAAADRQAAPAAAGRSETRPDGSLAAIPGLGASFTAKIPATTTQVVVATGQGKDTDKNSVTLWTRTPEGRWLAGETWQGHNGKNGWTTDHNEGDLRSPIGVFDLTDAGGRNANPGSKLPYDKDASFVVSGTGFFGDQLAGSFDYVVAINYNRVAGSSPLDMRRPMGSKKGGGIWLHVDHDGPTHGCVSIPEDKMAQLIRTLDPAAHPVIVMGDATSLAA